ncbi:MAG TPA: hypothetical protein VNH82_09075 [Candidatus Dormibacteraeota bacterium]|nr:hypothetical protein [Candidatus Dormibacteraeota bacterium]
MVIGTLAPGATASRVTDVVGGTAAAVEGPVGGTARRITGGMTNGALPPGGIVGIRVPPPFGGEPKS